jgi:hypothetical protein
MRRRSGPMRKTAPRKSGPGSIFQAPGVVHDDLFAAIGLEPRGTQGGIIPNTMQMPLPNAG